MREAGLDHGVVAQRAPGATRHLVARHLDEIIQHAAGYAAGDTGKADLVAGAGTHPIERTAFAAFAVEFAGHRMIRSHEEVLQRELVAGGAAQADRVPDVGPLDVFGAHQHRPLLRHAVGLEPRSAVGRNDRTMRAEPGRVPAAGGKGPYAGDPVAALAFDGADPGAGAPGQHRARVLEDRARYRQIEIGRRHGAAAGLTETPGRGRIGLGDGFDDVEERDRIGLDPVGRARQQQPEQPRVMELVEQRRRQPTAVLDLGSDRGNVRTQGLGTGNDHLVAGKFSSSRDQILQASPHPVRGVRDHAGRTRAADIANPSPPI